jgi:hypothetical protein
VRSGLIGLEAGDQLVVEGDAAGLADGEVAGVGLDGVEHGGEVERGWVVGEVDDQCVLAVQHHGFQQRIGLSTLGLDQRLTGEGEVRSHLPFAGHDGGGPLLEHLSRRRGVLGRVVLGLGPQEVAGGDSQQPDLGLHQRPTVEIGNLVGRRVEQLGQVGRKASGHHDNAVVGLAGQPPAQLGHGAVELVVADEVVRVAIPVLGHLTMEGVVAAGHAAGLDGGESGVTGAVVGVDGIDVRRHLVVVVVDGDGQQLDQATRLVAMEHGQGQ